MENYKEVRGNTYHVLHLQYRTSPWFCRDWQKAAEDVLDEAALAEAAGVGADEAGPAEHSAQAESEVSAKVDILD